MALGDIIPLDFDVLGGPSSSPVPAAGVARPAAGVDLKRLIAEEGAEHLEPIARSIYEQESGSGRNTQTSVDGARGGFQVIPATFQRFARPGERIDDPEHNARVGLRYLRFLSGKAGGDPAKIFAGYFSGEGNIGDTTPWKKDAKDGNGKSVSAYVADNLRRMTGNTTPVPQASNGKIVDAPDDLGIPASFVAAQAQPEGTGVGTAVARGTAHGWISLMGSLATGAEWLAGAMGKRDFQSFAQDIAADFEASAKQFDTPADLRGSILADPALMKKGAWWIYHLSAALPHFAASWIPGLGAAKVLNIAGQSMKLSPGLVAGLATAGGSAVAGAIGGGLEGTQTYREVLERGGSEQEARGAATVMALASGALNALSFGAITGRGKSALRRMIGGFITEGATEWAEEPVEGAILNATSVARPEDAPLERAYQGFNVFPIAGVLGGGVAVVAGRGEQPRQPIPTDRPHDMLQQPTGAARPTQSGVAATQSGLAPWQQMRERTSALPLAQRVPGAPVDITRLRQNVDAALAPTLTDAPEHLNFQLQPSGPAEEQADVNFKLTPPDTSGMNQMELDLPERQDEPQGIEGQLHLPVFDTPLQTKVKQGGKPNRSELIQTLNTVADPKRPAFKKGGDPKKWLASIMTANDPLSAIRTAYENGTHSEAELLDKWHTQLTNTSIEQFEKNGGYEAPKPKPVKRTARKPVERKAAPKKETVSEKIQKRVKALIQAPVVETVPVTTQPAKPKRTVKRVADLRRTTPDEKLRTIEDLETAYMQDIISQDDFEDLSKAIDDGEAGALQQARKVLDFALQTKEGKHLPPKPATEALLEQMKGMSATKSAGRMRKRATHDPNDPGYDATGASINLPGSEDVSSSIVEAPERVHGVEVATSDNLKRLARQGRLQDVLSYIAYKAENPAHRQLARLLRPLTKDVELHVIRPGVAYMLKNGIPGQLNSAYGVARTQLNTGEAEVFLRDDPNLSGLNEETILHEAIHAALIQRLGGLRRGLPAARTAQMMELWHFYREYMDGLDDRARQPSVMDTVPAYLYEPYRSADEFVTYALTSKPFQQFLKKERLEKTSLWDRFVAVVARILGFQGNKTYLERVLDAGYGLLEDAAQFEPGPSFRLDEPQGTVQALQTYVNAHLIEELPKNAAQTLTSMGDAARTKWLGAVTLRQISDLYKKVLPALEKYVTGVHRMDATVNRLSTAASEIAARWGGVKDADQLSEVMGLGTTQKIHPDRPFAEQTWLKDDPRAAENYNRLREKYNALSPEAKQVYKEAQKLLQDHWTQVRDLLKTEIAKTLTDPVARDGKLAQIEHEFGRVQGPYFPLSRFGKYILTAKKGGDESTYTVEFFENILERDAEVRDLQRQGYQVKTAIASEFNPVTDGVPSAFIRQMYEAIDNMPNMKSEVAKDMKDAVTQLYWRSLPEVAGAKRFLRRRTVKGWNKDMRRSFANAMFHGAFYRAKLEYAPELRRNLLDMDEQKRALQDETGSRDLADAVTNEINRRHDQAMRRVDTPFVDMLGRIGYAYYLGLTPSFALINMMQNPLVAYPMLAARHGWTKSFTAMLRAAKEFTGARFTADEQGRWTVELDLKRVTKDKQERAALQDWLDEGLVDLTQAHDLSAMSNGTSTAGRKAMKIASFLPHHTEVFNRVTAGLAGYRLARDAGQSHEAAVQYGKEVIANAHFDYSASNKPYYMSPGFSKMSKLIFMFKQYQQHMIFALARNLHQSFKGATSEDRAVARRTLFGLITMTSLAAGAMGLPFFGTAMILARLIYGMGDDDDPRDPEVEFRQFLADAFGVEAGELIAKGALRKTGVDVSQRLGMGDFVFRYTGKDTAGKEGFNQLIVDLLGPVFAIGSNVANSMQFFQRGDFRRGWEQIAPKVVKDLFKADRYRDEGLTSVRGVQRIKPEEFSTYDIVAQAMGFTPQKAAEHYAAQGAIQGRKEAIDNRRQLLISLAALARARNDPETFRETMEKIRRFSQLNPRQAITGDSITQAVQRIKEAEMLANSQGIYVKPKDRNLLTYGAFANVGRE